MFTAVRARRRHRRLLAAAQHLVRQEEVRINGDPTQVTATQIAVLAFARHGLRVEESEAADYLAAALVTYGHGIGHLPAVPAPS